ncbi:MAG: uroporphyrinogen-III C-methyltransferase [Thermodesulfobacteriota bacterium]
MSCTQMKSGKVFLVGAGPGDPGLITVKAREVLGEAEVVIYDYLASKRHLDYVPEEAERIYVGKKGGCHTMAQGDINQLIVERAGEGKRVVRLKGGDPFIFGRGGEEAEELVAAGVPFEVIPGVTSGIAAAAYAGIPLTHRRYTTNVAFITGHEDPTKEESGIAWDKIATGIGTLVFFMGVKNLPHIVENLVANGRSPETPCAVIRWGTTLKQETVVGRLLDIVQLVKEKGLKPPAITVVGEVVGLRECLSWFENKPLFGRSIVVTRTREQASDLVRRLEELGAACEEFPTIRIVPPDSWEPLDKAIKDIKEFDWVIFTSVNGVKNFLLRLKAVGGDLRSLSACKVAAIGPKTAEMLEDLYLKLDFVPSEYRAEGIIEGLKALGIAGKKALIPRAEVAREILPEKLAEAGAKVKVVPAYKTVKPEAEEAEALVKLLEGREIDMVTFTSSSTVSNFVEMLGRDRVAFLLKGVDIACIGPVTAETAQKFGIQTQVMPQEYTIDSMVQSIEAFYRDKGK